MAVTPPTAPTPPTPPTVPQVTLQDGGRHGYLRYGITAAGPMDPLMHATANRAAGNPLDATAVHPESYDAAKALLSTLGYELKDVKNGGVPGIGPKAAEYGMEKLANQVGVGLPTLQDIVAEWQKPGRDPRDELPKPVLRTDVLDIKDLKSGMELTGTVRNVIDFGAFIDIGVHQDGLVHISRMADRFIKHPSEVVKVGDVVKVWVVSVDEKKKRIALTMVKDRQ